jgi:hypothetical protein
MSIYRGYLNRGIPNVQESIIFVKEQIPSTLWSKSIQEYALSTNPINTYIREKIHIIARLTEREDSLHKLFSNSYDV